MVTLDSAFKEILYVVYVEVDDTHKTIQVHLRFAIISQKENHPETIWWFPEMGVPPNHPF